MLQGFKDFLFRGNILDLAIAVVVGTAFTALVTAFTGSFINPIIAAVGGANADGLAFRLISENPQTLVDVGGFINAAITFLITAAVVYFVFVVPAKAMLERRKHGEEPEPEPEDDFSEQIALLREIRDSLANR